MKLSWAIVVSSLVCGSANAADLYTEAMYRTALEDVSTSPLFVLVTLHDKNAGTDREVCIPAPFLLGAIITERGLGYSEGGLREAIAIAERQPGRVFTFTEPRARSNVQPRYTPELLEALRKRLLMASVEAALAAQTYDGGVRDAIGHLLLERGVLVGIADMGGNLFVQKPEPPFWRAKDLESKPSLLP
jgi:hypothetical protein